MIEFNVDSAPFDKMGNICTIMVGHRVVTTASHWPLNAGVNSDCVPSSVSRTYGGDFLMIRRNWRAYLNPVTLSPDAIFVACLAIRVECWVWDRCNFDVISGLCADYSTVKLTNLLIIVRWNLLYAMISIF